MLSIKSKIYATLIALNYLSLGIMAGYIGDHGSILGSYAEHFSGGKELEFGKTSVEDVHDFSEHAAESIPETHYESLGSAGDHLDAHSFPADFGEHSDGIEYEESASASEYHPEFESYKGDHEFLRVHVDAEDIKPVPGIDHGKGAFSYSTLYESKEHE